MLEKMDIFFENRLAGYDEHMITNIEGAAEFYKFTAAVSVESLHHFTESQKMSLYQRLFSALTENGYFILTDYFAETKELEKEYFDNLKKLKSEQNITDHAFYHYDTPLTVEHEMEILRNAGFSDVRILKNWGATYTLKAKR